MNVRIVASPCTPILALLLCAGCQGARSNLLSTHDEVLVGATLRREVESTELLLDNVRVQDYVAQVGLRLSRIAERKHVPYTFKVLDDDDMVDAFALPGGYVYVYTGLMRECDNEAELAGVIAHELGHVVARHHAQVLSKEYGVSIIRGHLIGSDTLVTGRMIDDMLRRFMSIEFDAGQESVADEISTDLMVRAGYDPEAKVSFLLKTYFEDIPVEEQPPIFSTTLPPTPERLDAIYELILSYPEEQREQTQLFEGRYADILRRLD